MIDPACWQAIPEQHQQSIPTTTNGTARRGFVAEHLDRCHLEDVNLQAALLL